jgi:hypothetical protein
VLFWAAAGHVVVIPPVVGQEAARLFQVLAVVQAVAVVLARVFK